MGFLNILGKVMGAVTGLGSVAGKQSEGAAKGKVTQAELQQRQDQNALERFQMLQNAQNQAAQTDLQRKNYESSNRSTTAKQALIASLLGGAGGAPMPTNISGGQRSGGLFDALRTNPDAIAALRNLHGQADQAQMAPMQFSGGNILQAPQLTALPKIDNGGFLSTLAHIGQLVGAAGSFLPKGEDDNQGNGASKPQAVDVMGSLPGGAVVPRTANPYLQSRDIRDLMLNGGGS